MGRTGVGPAHLQGLILITPKMGIGPITNGHPTQTQQLKAQNVKLLTIWSLKDSNEGILGIWNQFIRWIEKKKKNKKSSTRNWQIAPAKEEEEQQRKMIYRKWSLLTGPISILGGIVGAVVVANFIFVKNVKKLSHFLILFLCVCVGFFFWLFKFYSELDLLLGSINWFIYVTDGLLLVLGLIFVSVLKIRVL